MHILALETSHLPGSIYLAEAFRNGFRSLGDAALPGRLSTAQCFAPLVREMLRSAAIPPRDVGLVAVDVGPGSFTGLRIAVTFAKTFAYASGADALGISSMDILAHQAAAAWNPSARRLWTAVDAHRGQVFSACYAVGGDAGPRQVVETRIVEIDRWLARLEPNDLVTGPMVERLKDRLPAHVETVGSEFRIPTAETLARMAAHRWHQGERGDIWRLTPDYIRRSAAEEKLDGARP